MDACFCVGVGWSGYSEAQWIKVPFSLLLAFVRFKAWSFLFTVLDPHCSATAPKWIVASMYVAVGWVGIFALPYLYSGVGVEATALIVGGGVVYTLGALVYARQWPNPYPRVFGYHEIFHVLVTVAMALFYCCVLFYVLPHYQLYKL